MADVDFSGVRRGDGALVGVALIVSNDYSTSNYLPRLSGTHKDAENMTAAFTKLKYEVFSRKNIAKQELIDFINKFAAYTYPPSYRRLVFVFSGAGLPAANGGEKVITEEGDSLNVEELVDKFNPNKYPHLGTMARLFFFDMCRGTMTQSNHVSMVTCRVPTHGNILIAYSTLPNHQAYEDQSGGVWMRLLAEAIQTQNDDITLVLSNVSNKLAERFKSEKSNFPVWQTPQCISQLTEHVNFLKESSKLGNVY